jgi:hypothetical protein
MMIMIRASSVRIQYMQAYVFVDDSNDEQVTTLHETTGTRQLRALGLLTRQLCPAHSRQTPFGVV